MNSLRGPVCYAGLFGEGWPPFDLHIHLADNLFGFFGLEVTEDAELDKIGELEMIALTVQAHLVLMSPTSFRIVSVADVERR